MLISVHLPKTAGSSFRSSLQNHYRKRLLLDYADLPINTSPLNRNAHAMKMCVINKMRRHKNIECIHGHFLPFKYLLCKNAKFVTWMRDPIERLASHYYYWLRSYDNQNAAPLQRRVVEEEWSLERFCFSSELRNFYSQFLWGFSIERFDFIGITEYYDTEIEYFSREFLGTRLQAYNRNRNPDQHQSTYFDDKKLRQEVEEYHSKDVSLYELAKSIRQQERCNLQ